MRQAVILKPELVEVGDTIAVTYPESGGIKITKTGTVAKRIDYNSVRHMMTEEGSTIFSWEPGKNTGIQVVLLAKKPVEQPESMLDMFRERIGNG